MLFKVKFDSNVTVKTVFEGEMDKYTEWPVGDAPLKRLCAVCIYH